LLNSPLAREQSAVFARRLLQECGEEPANLVARAWQLAFGRPVTPAEAERAIAFLRRHSDSATVSGSSLEDLCLALFNANEFIYVD